MITKKWLERTLFILGFLAGCWLVNLSVVSEANNSSKYGTHISSFSHAAQTPLFSIEAEDTADVDSYFVISDEPAKTTLSFTPSDRIGQFFRSSATALSSLPLYLLHCAWRHHLLV